MLILTRRIGESLVIGDEVKTTVLGVNGNQVKIGVDAPKEITVHREEIYEKIKAEQIRKNEENDSATFEEKEIREQEYDNDTFEEEIRDE